MQSQIIMDFIDKNYYFKIIMIIVITASVMVEVQYDQQISDFNFQKE